MFKDRSDHSKEDYQGGNLHAPDEIPRFVIHSCDRKISLNFKQIPVNFETGNFRQALVVFWQDDLNSRFYKL